MSGYVFATAECGACGRVFTFAPTRVPVVVFDGERIPICKACAERANQIRRDNRIPEFEIPDGAYEPEPESNL